MRKLLPERLRLSVEAMEIYYPSLSFDGRQIITGGETSWKGWVQPLSADNKELEWILADIARDLPVQIINGEIRHHPTCKRTHQKVRRIEKFKRPDQAFNVKITYDGSQKHPRAYVMEPEIPKNKRKHMFGDGAVCAYPPQRNIWDWQTNSVTDFTDHVMIWLVKWNFWSQTQLWLGAETSHNKFALLSSIVASDQCWCGSGTFYGDCHQAEDKLAMAKFSPHPKLISSLLDQLLSRES